MSKSIKICVLGDGGVGKTAITVQFCSSEFVEHYDPTIEDSYRKQILHKNVSYMLEILDTAGQEEFIALRDQWIRDCEGFIIVYSIDDRRGFDQVEIFKDLVVKVKDEENSPTMLLGNKCDLEDKREVRTEEGKEMANKIQAGFLETSAKTRTNIEESFQGLLDIVNSNSDGKPAKKKRSTPNCTVL